MGVNNHWMMYVFYFYDIGWTRNRFRTCSWSSTPRGTAAWANRHTATFTDSEIKKDIVGFKNAQNFIRKSAKSVLSKQLYWKEGVYMTIKGMDRWKYCWKVKSLDYRDDTTNFLKHLKWVSVYCMYVLLKANQEI